jgi:dTDP-4-dehydrorhamnose reductase
MNKIAVFGGSGLVGQHLISTFMKADFNVISYQRRKKKSNFGEHQEIVDFDHINDYKFEGDTVIICLGTTIANAGSEDAFVKIDHDLIKNIGVWAKTQGVKKLHVISSTGASATAKGVYLKTKWRTEQSLQNIGFETLCIYRPSLYADVNRKPIRLKELLSIPALRFLGVLSENFTNYRPIKTKTLVKKLKENVLKNLKGRLIFESNDIQGAASLTFIEYRKREQYLVLKMILAFVVLWGLMELTGFSTNSLRIFTAIIVFLLLFLWVKSKLTLKKGAGNGTEESQKNLKSLQFMRILIWIELIAIVACIIFQLVPFVILLGTMLFIDIQIFYTIRDYLNGLNQRN